MAQLVSVMTLRSGWLTGQELKKLSGERERERGKGVETRLYILFGPAGTSETTSETLGAKQIGEYRRAA
jgi:hypothetical protein